MVVGGGGYEPESVKKRRRASSRWLATKGVCSVWSEGVPKDQTTADKVFSDFEVERVVLGVGCVVVTGRRVLLWCVVKERFPRVDLSSWGVYAGRSVQISADEEF